MIKTHIFTQILSSLILIGLTTSILSSYYIQYSPNLSVTNQLLISYIRIWHIFLEVNIDSPLDSLGSHRYYISSVNSAFYGTESGACSSSKSLPLLQMMCANPSMPFSSCQTIYTGLDPCVGTPKVGWANFTCSLIAESLPTNQPTPSSPPVASSVTPAASSVPPPPGELLIDDCQRVSLKR